MKQALNDYVRLGHILEAASDVLAAYATLPDGKLPDGDFRYYGFIKAVEIIGEAASRLTREFRARHSDVDWPGIIRLRHILVHDYHSVDESRLFTIIQTQVPVLRQWVTDYLATHPEE